MKNKRWWILAVLIVLIVSRAPLAAGQGSENDLLRLLRFVPDTPENRSWLTFGDLAAWHASWGVPRVDNVQELDALDRDPFAYWVYVMPTQTMPPEVLGGQYLLSDDLRAVYGFDLFNVDRYLYTGMPPHDLAVVEFSFDGAQITDALTATGYQSSPLETGGTLYQILGDYETDLPGSSGLPRLGMLGRLNRIALLNGQMVIGRATDQILGSLAAQQTLAPSLADDPVYVAAANALDDVSMQGDLMGAILIEGGQFAGVDAVGFGAGGRLDLGEVRDALLAQYQADPLPPFDLAMFVTRHDAGATYLTLVLVFPQDNDPAAAAETLANRLQNYASLMTGAPLADRWTFERTAYATVNRLPVAMVTMRVDDPEPAPPGERANAAVFDWATLIYRRDTGFLYTGP